MDETSVGEQVDALETKCEDSFGGDYMGTTTPTNPCGKTRSHWLAEGPVADAMHSIANGLEVLARAEDRGFR